MSERARNRVGQEPRTRPVRVGGVAVATKGRWVGVVMHRCGRGDPHGALPSFWFGCTLRSARDQRGFFSVAVSGKRGDTRRRICRIGASCRLRQIRECAAHKRGLSVRRCTCHVRMQLCSRPPTPSGCHLVRTANVRTYPARGRHTPCRGRHRRRPQRRRFRPSSRSALC